VKEECPNGTLVEAAAKNHNEETGHVLIVGYRVQDVLKIEIRDLGMKHKVAAITRDGEAYAAVYAEPFPTEASVRRDYYEAPLSFRPWDSSTGTFVKEGK
jgi:hypothetical protein